MWTLGRLGLMRQSRALSPITELAKGLFFGQPRCRFPRCGETLQFGLRQLNRVVDVVCWMFGFKSQLVPTTFRQVENSGCHGTTR